MADNQHSLAQRYHADRDTTVGQNPATRVAGGGGGGTARWKHAMHHHQQQEQRHHIVSPNQEGRSDIKNNQHHNHQQAQQNVTNSQQSQHMIHQQQLSSSPSSRKQQEHQQQQGHEYLDQTYEHGQSPVGLSYSQSLTSFGGSRDDDDSNFPLDNDGNHTTSHPRAAAPPFQVSRLNHRRNKNRESGGDDETQSEYTYDESAMTDVQESSVYDDDQTYDDSRYEDFDSHVEEGANNVTVNLNESGVHHSLFSGDPFIPDATRQVHEVHLKLLQLLSNPEYFYDVLEHLESEGVGDGPNDKNPHVVDSDLLPYQVFASDAEVVLPQALTASQLFGIEKSDGIELKAAVGMKSICQLFQRWLALMPGADHVNIIYPPGLTIMRIAGGRYRVTAAHRAVWKWLNHFLPDPLDMVTMGGVNGGNGVGLNPPRAPSYQHDTSLQVQFGDLVSMTIVDVFETDLDGKLLSYCPTFDNRLVVKTSAAYERWHKTSHRMASSIGYVRQSTVGRTVERATHQASRTLFRYAEQAASSVVTRFQQTTGASPVSSTRHSPMSVITGSKHPPNGILRNNGKPNSKGGQPYDADDHDENDESQLSLPNTTTSATSTMKDALALAEKNHSGVSPSATATPAGQMFVSSQQETSRNHFNFASPVSTTSQSSPATGGGGNPYYMSDDDTTAYTKDTQQSYKIATI